MNLQLLINSLSCRFIRLLAVNIRPMLSPIFHSICVVSLREGIPDVVRGAVRILPLPKLQFVVPLGPST